MPLTPEHMISQMIKCLLPELYDAIYYTLYDYDVKNNYRYNTTESNEKATTIWLIASNWEYLITCLYYTG